MVLIYSVAGEPLLRIVFGEDLTDASDALPFLGLAMSLLACSYLSVQYLLAMGKASFLFVLGRRAWSRSPLLLSIGDDLTAIAIALFGDPGRLRRGDPDDGDAPEDAHGPRLRAGLAASRRREHDGSRRSAAAARRRAPGSGRAGARRSSAPRRCPPRWSATGLSQRITSRGRDRSRSPMISRWTGAVVTTPGCMTS